MGSFLKSRLQRLLKTDKTEALIIFLLLGLGTVMVFSASAPYAKSNYGDSLYFIKRQIFWLVMGGVGMAACAVTPIELHRRYTAPIGFSVAILCLILVLFSGASVKRWLNLGFFSFQPSELMKPMLILITALYMEWAQKYVRKNGISGRHGGRISDRRQFWKASFYGTFLPIFGVSGVCVLIMLENHFSGTLITFAVGATVVFAGGAMIRWFAGAGGIVVGAVFAVLFGTDYASERIDIWLHPENFSVRDETWQITQGLIAIGSGGVFGRGLGNGLQKQLYVSAPHNDFIFSIVCEELGLIGAVTVILLFCAFIKRGIKIAAEAESVFASLTAVGITCHVGLQAFLNIGVVTGTVPNTGVTLPFFSYGGSALVVLMCEMGILLSASVRNAP